MRRHIVRFYYVAKSDFKLQNKILRYVSTLEDDAASSHDESSAEIHLDFSCADFYKSRCLLMVFSKRNYSHTYVRKSENRR